MASTAPKPAPEEVRGRVWQFGECSFDELRYEVRVRGKVVELEAKPLEVLYQLLMRAGDVVRKEDLLDSVWPEVLVVDASLATAVSKLRKVLGEGDAVIKTVPKVGYRLSVPVRCSSSKQPALLAAPEGQPSIIAVPWPAKPESRPYGSDTVSIRRFIGWGIVATLLVAGLAVSLTLLRRRHPPSLIPGPVAILPFQNASSNPNLDYLRSALPDQVAMSLSAARSLSVRPLATSSGYAGPSIDLQKAGRELNVNRIVTGHFVLAGEQLQVTMEAVDTEENRVLWHDTVNVPANNLLMLQAQVAAMSRGKLASARSIRLRERDGASSCQRRGLRAVSAEHHPGLGSGA